MEHIIDILIFATLAVYLFYRLWVVLGTRNGSERPPLDYDQLKEMFDIQEKTSNSVQKPYQLAQSPSVEDVWPADILAGVEKIKAIDPTFNLEDFLEGASRAFKLIVEGFADGDLDLLKELLHENVYIQFEKAIKARSAKGFLVHTTLNHIVSCTPLAIEIKNSIARITVKFISEQVKYTQNGEGQILDNPAKLAVTVTDVWTFSKDIRTSEPTWFLSATHAV